VIFLCGVLVGRGVRPDRAPVQEALATEIAADPGVAPAPEAAPPPAVEPPAPADELSYPDRLQRDIPAVETLKPTPSPPVPTPEPPPVAAEPAPRMTQAPPVQAPSPQVASVAPADGASDPSGPGFAVQVAAYTDRRDADTVAKQLVAKGYPAFVMEPVKGAPRAMYRVRVGKYRNRRDAEAISSRLETVEKFNPWIAR
jgi:cell division protein FtsN